MSDIQVFNPLDQAIAEWLEAKTNKSNSQRTAQSYRDNMADFRAVLAERNADLLSDPRLVALVAEQWTASTRPIMHKDGTIIRQRQLLSAFRHSRASAAVCSIWKIDATPRRQSDLITLPQVDKPA